MSQRPDTAVVQQLPISVYSGWDKVQDILSLLAQHDYGQFRSSAIFVDALWRDDRFKGVMGARVGSVIATPFEHKPASRKRIAQKARDLVAGNEDEPGVFDLICPASVLSALVGWMVTEGLCVAELIWVEHPRIKIGRYKMWIPRLRVWHPQFVYWDWSTFSYVLTTRDGLVYLPKVDEKIYSDGKWFVYCPDGYQYGWLRAAVRSLAIPIIARGWANRDWSRHSEVQGIAMRKAFAPADADEGDKDEFFNNVANAGAELTILCERPDQGGDTGFDVKYEEAKARTWECFKDLLHSKNTDIAIDLLGQDLSTEASPTGLGSGVAQLQNQVRMDIRQRDAKLADALRNQVLSWWAFYNFDDPELAPMTSLQVNPPEDELQEATTIKTFGDAFTALGVDVSEHVDGVAILDKAGVPIKSDEEIAAARLVEQQRAQEQFELQQKRMAAAPPPQQLPPGKRGAAEPVAPKDQAQLGALAPHPKPGPVARYTFQGLPIAVENKAGTMRHWYAAGEAMPRGSTQMQHDYGYIEGYAGADGEDLDVYIGPDESATSVHIVHQHAANRRTPADDAKPYERYDEDKIFLGFPSADAARAAFLAHRNDGERALGGMSSIPLERFKAKLQRRTGRGKITARAELAADTSGMLEALEQLAARASDRPPAPAKRTLAGKKRAARYVDRLQDNAKKIAARALGPDLAELKEQIKAAASFDDLRKRVTATYKDKMDPKRLAELVRKVNLMAHLYGRVEAVDSL